MKSKIIIFVILCFLVSCTKSIKINEASVVSDTTETAAFKPVDFEEQIVYNRAIEAVIWGNARS